MKHLDLFSGIGGFALAAEWTWPGIEHVFCEIDPFCQAIIKKHFPNSPIYGDIRTLTADAEHERLQGGLENKAAGHVGQRDRKRCHEAQEAFIAPHTDRERGHARADEAKGERRIQSPFAIPHGRDQSIDILTGGFPCQPFSAAGRRRGTEDDRYLWPEMLRVIREFHPRWIIGENVGGLVTWNEGMVLEQVHIDLESEGYEVQAFVIPACALNAPHRRDRVWIVAHTVGSNAGRDARKDASSSEKERVQERHTVEQLRVADTIRILTDHAQLGTRRDQEGSRQHGQRDRDGRDKRTDWNQDWTEVAARLCVVDDGLPNGLARPRGWRNAALKGAGNAIVPQVAYEIMKSIAAT